MNMRLLCLSGWLCLSLQLTPLLTQPIWAQTSRSSPERVLRISGTIKDETGGPVEGATVQVKGSNIATTAKADGSFVLAEVAADAVLVISAVGFTTQELPLSGKKSVTITLRASARALDEVIVVGYGTRKRSDVTGAISSIKAEQIAQVPTNNLVQALQGRLPGVVVTNTSFRPGETPYIRIRGNRSFTAPTNGSPTFSNSDNPVVVVDGIITPYSISDFNPLDIESIDVLKDASATAIYGSRGANGVIILTTKKGKAGKLNVDFDSYLSFESPLRELEMMNGGDFAELRRQANRNNAAVRVTYAYPYADPKADAAIFPEYYTRESVLDGYQWRDRANLIPAMRATTAAEKTAWSVDSVPVYDPAKVRSYDWQSQALRTGITQNYQLRLSGGNDKIRGSFSGGYYRQNGIQLANDYTRYSASMSGDYKPNSALSFGAVINASSVIQNYGPEIYGGASGQIPLAVPYDTLGQFILYPGGESLVVNPLNDPNTIFDERRMQRAFGSFYGEVQPAKGLKLRVNFGPDYSGVRRGTFAGSLSTSQQGSAPKGSFKQENYFNWTLENLVFYDKKIGSAHSVGITLLQSLQKQRYENSSISADNLPYETQKWYALQSTRNPTGVTYSSDFTQTQLISYMGRLNYTLLNRYLFTASGRWDGASQLATGHKWKFFPSAAFAWKITEESFMKNVMPVDQLKLRLGYGSVGQPNVAPYTTAGPLRATAYSWDETPAYGYAPGLATPDLTWPVTYTLNGGIDFTILHNRITGAIDLYKQDTKNQIQSLAVPGTSGFTSIPFNIGHVRNSGLEISLSTVNIRNEQPGGFRWTSELVFSRNKEQIIDIDGTKTDNIGNTWFIGQPIAVYYNYKFDGIFQDTKADRDRIAGLIAKNPALGNPSTNPNALSPGIIKVRDLNNDSLLNTNDYMVLGSPNPKWTGSFNNTFSYKGFDLSIYAFVSWGAMINTTRTRPSMAGRYQQIKVNYWTPANPSNEYPKPILNNDIPLFGASLQYSDGSFVRIRSISLQYTLPRELVSRLHASNFSVYINAVNPFLFSKFKQLDPEVVNAGTTSGVGTSVFFNTRSIVLGFKLSI